MVSKNNHQQGFTVVEAVVSAAVFAFVVVSSLGVYLSVLQLDSRTRAERAVQQNGRFIMDYLAKEIRNGSIDYTGTNNSTTLSLINQLDQKLIIQLDGSGNINLTKVGVGTTTLNTDSVRIARFLLFLEPTVDPFVIGNNVHIQPHVTVVLRVESKNLKDIERGSIDLQSTFAVRDYPAR